MKLCCPKCGNRIESKKKDGIINFYCLNCGKITPIYVSNKKKKDLIRLRK